MSDTQFTVRRQFIGTTNSSGVVTFTAGSNETFNAFADADYTLSILTAGGGTGVQGDIVDLDGKLSGTGTASLTVTDNSILGNAQGKTDCNHIENICSIKNKNNATI